MVEAVHHLRFVALENLESDDPVQWLALTLIANICSAELASSSDARVQKRTALASAQIARKQFEN
jgi:hypothetical protein